MARNSINAFYEPLFGRRAALPAEVTSGRRRRRLGVAVGECCCSSGGEGGADGRERPLLAALALAARRRQQAVAHEEILRLVLVVDGHVLGLGGDDGVPEGREAHLVDGDLQLDARPVVLEDVVEERVDLDDAVQGLEVRQAAHDLGADHAVLQGAQGVGHLLVDLDVGENEMVVCRVRLVEFGVVRHGSRQAVAVGELAQISELDHALW
ncbi:hypothetical protein PG994_005438 [Apiospora phragmitis]|uniref:Uncharacterized protein n=1 Tax=Apiospora phragmitis TaxID=2905665 RepID=A0ABR1VC81_9PEZI